MNILELEVMLDQCLSEGWTVVPWDESMGLGADTLPLTPLEYREKKKVGAG